MKKIVLVQTGVVISLYLSVWSYLPAFTTYGQSLSVLLILMTALLALSMMPVKWIRLSGLELILILLGCWSIIVGFILGDFYASGYGLVFIFIMLSFACIGRIITLKNAVEVILVAFGLTLITHLITDWDLLKEVVSIQIGSQGLSRFSPLGMHANLTGLVYAGGAALFLSFALLGKSIFQRLFFAFGAALFCLIVISASARASILALVITAILMFFLLFNMSVKVLFRMAAGGSLFFLLFLFQPSDGTSWIGQILELDSDTRGLGSGASGRDELWARGLSLFFNNQQRFLFGGGFRSSEEGVIGFLVESSYITILLEFGFLLGGLTIFIFLREFYLLCKFVYSIKNYSMHTRLYISTAVCFFSVILFQSIFNRYLISIGNPYGLSLLFLIGILARYRS